MRKIILLLFIQFIFIASKSQTSYTWNGSTSTDWNTGANWTPVGIPNTTDHVTIVTGANNCVLPSNKTITNLTITSGLLNLGGFTLNTTGVVACNSGTCSNGTFNSTASSLTFAGTFFTANITATVADIYFNGSVFNGSVTVTKTGATNNSSTGNNTFNNFASITNNSSGILYLTNGGVGRVDNFNGNTTINVTSTGAFYLGYSRDININSTFTVNNTAGSAAIFLGVNNSNINLNIGATLSCGTFAGSTLYIYKLIQAGVTSQTLSVGNSARVNFYNCNFTGNLTVNSGDLYSINSTYSGTVTYNLGGTILNTWSAGGNTYNGILTVNNSSNGFIGFANGTGDTYNADVYCNNTSTTGGRIIFGNNSTSNFNGDIYVSQNGTTNASGIAIGWGGTFPVINLASGKNIFVNGSFSSGYLQLLKIQTAAATTISLTTTGNSNVQLNNNTFNGNVNVTAPDIYPYGGTYNAPVSFRKTGGGSGNHNNGNINIFNSKLNLENISNDYILLSYNSADQFNDNVTVSNTGTSGIFFGWFGDSGTPTLAPGKTISVGTGGFNAGALHLGSFTQLGAASPLTLTLTGTAMFRVEGNTIPCAFNSSVNITAPNIEIRGGTFNQDAEFTKTGGTSNHNNGKQNIFNGKCIVNQKSNTGYFMLGYNSNDLFNGDIIVTNTGTQDIYFGWGSGTGTPTQAAGYSITVGAAGFTGGGLIFNTFTQLGATPVNLTFTGTSAFLRFARNSVFNGNVITATPRVFFDGAIFNGILNSTKTGSNSDAGSGGNTFNQPSQFTNNGTGYLMFGNGTPDTWNADATFSNNSTERIILAYNSIGNIFNGNVTLNSSGSAIGISFCDIATSTASMTVGHSINTGTYSAGYIDLARFTQLGTNPNNLSMSSTATYLRYGPSSQFGGNVTSISPRLLFSGCVFNGIVYSEKTGAVSDVGTGNNIFNGLTTLINSGAGYLMLGNTLPDVFNNDVTFTNIGSDRILPAWNSVGNLFNGNIYLNTNGSSQGIHFCGAAIASATLAATKTIATGTLGLNAGYVILPRFTQLGSAPVTLSMSATASYIQYGPQSMFGGNVTSVSPGLYFNGCTFNGTVGCTKNGTSNDASTGNNIFNGVTNITQTGTGYILLGNGSQDQFNTNATFNNYGSNHMYVAYNSNNNTFGGITTFNNSPLTNQLIYVSPYSAGTIFNDNIVVTSTSGQGVQFCTSNATASATLVAGKTISVGGAGFSSGTLLLRQFTQIGPTPQTFTLTGTGNLTFGPTSYFGGNVTSSSPTLFYNGVNFNGTLLAVKTGTTNDSSTGGNIFNGNTSISNNGDGHFLIGNTNRDQFNSPTIFNNNGGNRFYFAHNHGGQTTTFASDLTLNSNKSVSDGWSYFVCEGTNTAFSVGGGFTVNCLGTAQSNFRFMQGTGTTAIYNGDVVLNLNNSHANTTLQMGVQGLSYYNGNISVANTLGGTGSGILFNTSALGSSTLAATKSISLGTGGFVSGDLSLIRFTQLSATPQTMLQTTGNARIILGPTSRFDGDVNFNFPQVLLNGTIYNGITIIQKNGASNNAGVGGNTFNGITTIINSGTGYLMTGNTTSDIFNAVTTFSNIGTHRIYVAHNHTGQTTTFAQDVNIFSNKTGNADAYSFSFAEGTNTHLLFNGKVNMNVLGSFRSDIRIIDGASTTATYNEDVSLDINNSNTSTSIMLGRNGLSYYNGDIAISNLSTIGGVYFNNATVASSTMSATKSIYTKSAGYDFGVIDLPRFTQLGSTINTLTCGINTRINFGPTSNFGGNVTSESGALFYQTTNFGGNVIGIKNGTTNDASFGGNTFNGTASLTVNGTGYLLMANNQSDSYKNNVLFSQNGTGLFYPNHNTNCTYEGNITLNSTSSKTITFGQAAGGIATLTGGNQQIISKIGSAGNPNFTRLIINKSADSVRLQTRVNITNTLSLQQGIVHTTSVNILNMNNNSLTNLGNSNSFINGPMNYDKATSGATTLNLPIGKLGSVLSGTAFVSTSDWRPAILTVNHNNTTSYTYNSELFIQSAEFLVWSMPTTVSNVSRIHWWDIERKNTNTGVVTPTLNLSGNQTITLFYDFNDGVTDPTNLTIVKNTYTAPTAWRDIGGTGSAITTGSITSTSAPTAFNSFSRFTLGNRVGGINPLPIELLSFTAEKQNDDVLLKWTTASEKNNNHFEIERSKDGYYFEYVTKVNAYGNGYSSITQNYETIDTEPYSGLSYYRLKQVDVDGTYDYSTIVSIEFNKNKTLLLYPNPTNNSITLYGKNSEEELNINIINALGATVKSIKVKNNTIDVSDLANGLYYLELQNSSQKETIKFNVLR